MIGDLRDPGVAAAAVEGIEDVYQLAADMGGAGYIFTGEHDACVMHNSATINLNTVESGHKAGVKRFFYSSSACIYPERNQMDPDNPNCAEESAYPAAPDSEYGWEKLFSERLYLAYARNYGIEVHIARFHNIFGPEGTWRGGREKAPAAICRKVAEVLRMVKLRFGATDSRPGHFCYIDECLGRCAAPDGIELSRAGQHRLRRNGNDQTAGRDGNAHCWQAPPHSSYSRTAGRPRKELR